MLLAWKARVAVSEILPDELYFVLSLKCLFPHPPPATGLACMVGCFPSHVFIKQIFGSCLRLSLSRVAVTNSIFSLIPFLTFFPPRPFRRHQEICISILTAHDSGTVKITHDTRDWEWHHRQVLFDIYAGMPYIAPLAKLLPNQPESPCDYSHSVRIFKAISAYP